MITSASLVITKVTSDLLMGVNLTMLINRSRIIKAEEEKRTEATTCFKNTLMSFTTLYYLCAYQIIQCLSCPRYFVDS